MISGISDELDNFSLDTPPPNIDEEESLKKEYYELRQKINALSKSNEPIDEYIKREIEFSRKLKNIESYKLMLESPLCNFEKEIIEKIKRLRNEFLYSYKKKVQIRPRFFEYCGEGKRYAFEPFNTPMDYLQEVLDKIPRKSRTATVDITDLIPKPNFRGANNHQLPKIIEVCTKKSNYIRAMQSNEAEYLRIREAHNDVVEELRKWKINENTIRVIIYKAFSKKGEKHYDNEYSKIKRHLVSWIYQSSPEEFKKVIEMSK